MLVLRLLVVALGLAVACFPAPLGAGRCRFWVPLELGKIALVQGKNKQDETSK